MSMMFFQRSAFIRLPNVTSEADFKQLLRRFASEVRIALLAGKDHDLWSMFDCIDTELETKSEAEAIELMLGEMEDYFDEEELEFDDKGTALYVKSDNDADNHCDEFVDALAIFLMPYCSDPYLTLSTTYHDGCSASTDEQILYRSGDQILKASTDALIERLFSDPAAMVTVLQSTPPVGEPVQQMLRATA